MPKNIQKRPGGFSRSVKKVLVGGDSLDEQDVRNIYTEEQIQSPFRTAAKSFLHNKIAMAGVITFLVILLACFILPIFFPLDVNYQDVTQQNISPGFTFLDMPNSMTANPIQIDGGSTFGAGIDQNGNVQMWGKLTPRLKNIPKELQGNAAAISCGQDHVLALDQDGKLYTWGYNRFALDHIPFDLEGVKGVTQIEAGYQISAVVTDKGKLYYWGNENIVNIKVGKNQGNIQKIAANTSTLIALTKDANVVALTGKTNAFTNVPEEVQGRAIDVASTDKSAAALTEDGVIHVWGSKDYGIQDVPEELQGNAAAIYGGRNHFSALDKNGKVYTWGLNNFKQSSVPSSLANRKVTQLVSSYHQNYAITDDGKVTAWGLKGYLMGTDGTGRDIFTRLISGGRMTMTIGAIAVIIATIIGVIVGGFSGYYGGKVDNLLMRLAEVVNAIPFLPLAIILSALVGNRVSEVGRISMIMVILGVLSWPGLARLVRGQILAEREKEFVTAAKAMGVTETGIIFRHIIPNVITVIIVNATLSFASCLLTESSLSFLGFGVVEPNPTWGNMLKDCQSSVVIGTYWWRWVFPSLVLSLSTISINLIGDGLRDAIDPKSAER